MKGQGMTPKGRLRQIVVGALVALSPALFPSHAGAGHKHHAHNGERLKGTTAVVHWVRLPALFVTGYDLYGRTATGWMAGPGVCAVDPRYIPLGSLLSIPGVGQCRAEDTGGAIIGWHVDVWFPTAAQCYAVTGTYYGALYVPPRG